METVFTAGWMISLPLCILVGLVLWVCLMNDDAKWQVEVSGNKSQPCGDQVEIETEDGPMILTCDKDKHDEEEGHGAVTVDAEYVNSWRWSWPQ